MRINHKWAKWVFAAFIVAALFCAAWLLPVRELIGRAAPFIQGLGPAGAVVFGLAYIIAVVLLVPASALTIAAGLLFGLVAGTVTVSIGSTIGAALAFLIGRYAARDKVERLSERVPTFAAIDRAISRGGWKIVALLRLSPAIPFNIQNYLYGLTAIRFWPCVLTSWIAMLPGTVMYVYIGYLAREGVAAASESQGVSAGQWALRILGFVATVAVTIYVTKLARSALREQTKK